VGYDFGHPAGCALPLSRVESAPRIAEQLRMPPRLSRPSSKRPLNGMVAFVRAALRDFRQTGAVLPSTPMLARTMTRSMRRAPGPKRVLEVGPGTGPFTREMLRLLRDGDELHIVEISPIFAERLEKVLLAPYRARHRRVRVVLHCHPIESAPLDGEFDFIVCSLPFNNFPPQVVRSIFRRLMDLLKPGGELAYFEYAGVRVMKGPLVGNKGRKNLKRIDAMGKVLRRRHHGRRELVLANMPPAVAVRLRG
jgi:phosphatidylethanolamine/phosphatidyl-N-methylethanolamine N-methyltransferase